MPFYSRRSRAPSSPEAPPSSAQTREQSSRSPMNDSMSSGDAALSRNRSSVMGPAPEAQTKASRRGILRQSQDQTEYNSPMHRYDDGPLPPSSSTRTNTPRHGEYESGGKRRSVPNVSTGETHPYKRFSSLPTSQLLPPPEDTILRRPDSESRYEPSHSPLNVVPAHVHTLAHPKFRAMRFADTESDRLARACGQLPIGVDSARQRSASCTVPSASTVRNEDKDGRGRERRSNSLRVGPNSSLPRQDISPHSPRRRSISIAWSDASEPPAPPRFQPEDPLKILRILDVLLRVENQRLEDYIEVEEFLQQKEKEAEVWKKRLDRLEVGVEREESANGEKKDDQPRVFGAPLLDALDRSSIMTIMGGHQHEIPTVVHACIEELYRTGIYQSDLFRALPNRQHLVEIVRIFDNMTAESDSSSAHATLRHASMADICAVLSSFVNSLPESLLDRTMHNALWTWCVRPAMTRESEKRAQEMKTEMEVYTSRPTKMFRKRSQSEPKTPPSSCPSPQKTPDELRQEIIERERPQVAIARHLLQLIPVENLSLLAYLCAFFTQIPLCPENGLTYEDIARIFGHRLLGGPSKNGARILLVWLLNRWSRIADGLFHAEGDGKPVTTSTKKGSDQLRRASIADIRSRRARENIAPHEDDLDEDNDHDSSPSVAFAPVGRPYSSSVSSNGSSSTYASTADSEREDLLAGHVTLGHNMQGRRDRKAEYEERLLVPQIPNERVLHVVPEREDFNDPRYEPSGVITPFTDEYDFLHTNDYFRTESTTGEEDSESTYSREDEPDHKHGVYPDSPSEYGDTSPPIPNNKTQTITKTQESGSSQVDAPVLPADLPSSNRELLSAWHRISELERELQLAKAERKPISEDHAASLSQRQSAEVDTKTKTAVEKDEDRDEDTILRRLDAVVSERDDARRIMQGLQKYIESALEK